MKAAKSKAKRNIIDEASKEPQTTANPPLVPGNFDMLVHYGRQLAIQDRLSTEGDEKFIALKSSNKPERTRYEMQHRESEENITSLEQIIINTKATSLDGAAIQLLLIGSYVEYITMTEGGEDGHKVELRKIQRLIYSIRDEMFKHSQSQPEEALIQRYMPERLNPWAPDSSVSADPALVAWNELQSMKTKRASAPDDDETQDAMWKDEWIIKERLLTTPAHTPEGLKLQLRIFHEESEAEDALDKSKEFIAGIEASIDNLSPKY
jgi:hypothetical protein